MHFKGAISESKLIFVAYDFVDDRDLIETTKYDTLDEVMENMQKGMDTWGGMIGVTGGA